MNLSSVRRLAVLRGDPERHAEAWCLDDFAFTPPDESPVSAPDPIADAYALGFEEGRREGEVAEQARLRAARRTTEEALDVIRANEERWSDSIDENIIALAIAAARHVVDRELALDPALVAQIVARALEAFPIDQPVRVRINPGDLAVLNAGDTPSLEDLAGVADRGAHWIADARVVSGGCIVEGRDRIVDGRVDSALERVYRRLTHQHG
ncbi:MAG: FliH/SctL family protein [Gemmatimonadaceae bacterium]